MPTLAFCPPQHYPHLCKPNLHQLACRLHIQEEQRGCVKQHGELWVEQSMQVAKKKTKYRASAAPEKVWQTRRWCVWG